MKRVIVITYLNFLRYILQIGDRFAQSLYPTVLTRHLLCTPSFQSDTHRNARIDVIVSEDGSVTGTSVATAATAGSARAERRAVSPCRHHCVSVRRERRDSS